MQGKSYDPETEHQVMAAENIIWTKGKDKDLFPAMRTIKQYCETRGHCTFCLLNCTSYAAGCRGNGEAARMIQTGRAPSAWELPVLA